MKKKRTKKKEDTKNRLLDILIRYSIIFLVSVPGLWLFYSIFTPLTVYPVYWLVNLFFDATVIGNVVMISNQIPIDLIPACIAGSAYFLLFALNLSIPKIKLKKRLTMLGISFLSLLLINILRIFVFILLFMSGYFLFDLTHKIFWYGLSTLFVVGIWFIIVKKFKVKEIPLYSDIKYLYSHSNLIKR